MKLIKLQLENFRNHKSNLYEFPSDKDLIILVGKNGAGKTNFLEAIYMLSLGKSFRSLVQDDLIHWQKEYLRCNAEVKVDNENINLEVFYSTAPLRKKNFKKNGVNLKNSEYLGNLLTVLFHPEDLNMLDKSPRLRRHYLDVILSQVDKNYLIALSKYKKALKQRNILLDQLREAQYNNNDTIALNDDLSAWDEEIIEFGSTIILKRLEYIAFLNQKIENNYCSISGNKDKITVEYVSKIIKKSSPDNEKIIAGMYNDELFNRKKRDIFQAQTSSGPHRDDVIFYLNGKNICSCASRGELRTLLLALKLTEIDFIRTKTNKNPILLLDDVFSELDRKRQIHLLKSIKGCQTIITTTELSEDIKSLSEHIIKFNSQHNSF